MSRSKKIHQSAERKIKNFIHKESSNIFNIKQNRENKKFTEKSLFIQQERRNKKNQIKMSINKNTRKK